MLRALHIIEVAQFLIAVVDGRTAETLLPVARSAGTGEEIAAVVQLEIENIQGYWIDVRSVTSDVRTTKCIEVSIARMVRRAVCRSQRGRETGSPPVAGGNGRQEGICKTPRVDTVLLPRSLVAEECEQLVLNDRTA